MRSSGGAAAPRARVWPCAPLARAAPSGGSAPSAHGRRTRPGTLSVARPRRPGQAPSAVEPPPPSAPLHAGCSGDGERDARRRAPKITTCRRGPCPGFSRVTFRAWAEPVTRGGAGPAARGSWPPRHWPPRSCFFPPGGPTAFETPGRRAPSALAGRPPEPRPRPRAGGQRGRRPERARRRLWAALPARREFKGLRPEACLPREVPADAGGAAAQLSHSLCPGSARARRLHRAGGFSPGRRLPASLSRLCKARSLGSGLRRPCAARAPRGQERGRAPSLARGHPRRPHRRGAPGPPGAVVPRCASPSPGDPSPHRRGGCWTAREPQPDSRPPRARGARKHGRRRTRGGGAAAALAAATDVAVAVLLLVVLPRPGLTRGGPSISSS
nr:uncharacterized protein LOC106782452 [Equus caballus]